tara:strand:+ start:868 stop:1020 length:153 start_codon:yes stop_codon:yes gene_type:complete
METKKIAKIKREMLKLVDCAYLFGQADGLAHAGEIYKGLIKNETKRTKRK